MACLFCNNIVYEDRMCQVHYNVIRKMYEGKASPTLNEIFSSQKREECYVPSNKDVLFGYSKVPIVSIALYISGLNYHRNNRYIRTCGTRNCHNAKHLVVGDSRSENEFTLELRQNKVKINKLIRDVTRELCCIPGFIIEDNGKAWTYYDNRKIQLGTALLNYHVGSQSGTPVRLCTTNNCYNQLHYKWGTTLEQEKLRKKRLAFEKPDTPPEIEYEIHNKYKQMKSEDIPMSMILTTLAKVYKTNPSTIQSIIAWSKFR